MIRTEFAAIPTESFCRPLNISSNLRVVLESGDLTGRSHLYERWRASEVDNQHLIKDKGSSVKCERCRYWGHLGTHVANDVVPGQCHRNPPVQIVTGHQGPNAKSDANAWTFPIVYSSSWCGEFREAV